MLFQQPVLCALHLAKHTDTAAKATLFNLIFSFIRTQYTQHKVRCSIHYRRLWSRYNLCKVCLPDLLDPTSGLLVTISRRSRAFMKLYNHNLHNLPPVGSYTPP